MIPAGLVDKWQDEVENSVREKEVEGQTAS
jgi:hypothetical protein